MSIQRHEETTAQALSLIAYQVSALPLRLERASVSRAWMEQTRGAFARRCLPLLLANAGWNIVTTVPFRATWDGSPDKAGLHIEPLHAGALLPCISHFGHGILTFTLPWLFRTAAGYNLLLRGPANLPKDGIAPLEGLVEADHATATATMNWQLTRAGLRVSFEAGEPIAQIVPVRRGEMECFTPTILPLSDEPALAAAYRAWTASRTVFLSELNRPGSEACAAGWQKDYVREAQQTRRTLCPFDAAPEKEGRP